MAEFTNIKINDIKYDVRDANAARASDLAAKQDVISDLSAIRSGASKGATAIQPADLAAVATSGSYNDLTDKPVIPEGADLSGYYTKTEIDNKGFITTETDPTVPSWAKQSSKPTYTAQEVGALPASTTIPTKVSDLTNDSGFITSYTETDPTVPAWAKSATKPSYTASEVGAVPTTRKVNEKALSSNITLTASDVGAVPTTRTVNGKALSSNITLSASDVGADVFVVNIESDGNDGYTCDKTNAEIYAAWQAGRNIVLIKDDGFLYKLNEKPGQIYCEFSGDDYDDLECYRHYSIVTSNGQQQVIEESVEFQECLQSGTNIKTINNLSLLGSGNLTASDIGALPSNTHIPADQVQSNWSETNTSSKAYIQNKPTIPAAQVNADWNATSGVSRILNKPTIPTVPTKVSSFTNDAGYLTQHQSLANYYTKSEIDTKIGNIETLLASI